MCVFYTPVSFFGGYIREDVVVVCNYPEKESFDMGGLGGGREGKRGMHGKMNTTEERERRRAGRQTDRQTRRKNERS